MTSEAPELLPCPFCGGEAELLELPDPDAPSTWTIRCCHIDDFAYGSVSPEYVLQCWNARAYLPHKALEAALAQKEKTDDQ